MLPQQGLAVTAVSLLSFGIHLAESTLPVPELPVPEVCPCDPESSGNPGCTLEVPTCSDCVDGYEGNFCECVTPSTATYFDTVESDSPQFYFNLEEPTGDILPDGAGNCFNEVSCVLNYYAGIDGTRWAGTVPSEFAWTSNEAEDGSLYELKAASENSLGMSAALDYTVGMTVEGWFKVNDAAAEMGYFAHICANTGVAGSAANNILQMGQNGGAFYCTINNPDPGSDATLTVSGGTVTTAGHHLACTWDGTELALYNDGVLVDSGVLAEFPTVASDYTTGFLFVFGVNHPYFPPLSYMDGFIDEISMFDYAVSSARIKLHAYASDLRTALVGNGDLRETCCGPEEFYNPTTDVCYEIEQAEAECIQDDGFVHVASGDSCNGTTIDSITSGMIYVKPDGNSVLFGPRSDFDSWDPDRLRLIMKSVTEFNEDGVRVGKDGKLRDRHSFNNFNQMSFEIDFDNDGEGVYPTDAGQETYNEDGFTAQDLAVKFIEFHADQRGEGRNNHGKSSNVDSKSYEDAPDEDGRYIKLMIYVFTEPGFVCKTSDTVYASGGTTAADDADCMAVEAGTFKFSVVVGGWSFCDEDAADSDEDAYCPIGNGKGNRKEHGAYIGLEFAIVSAYEEGLDQFLAARGWTSLPPYYETQTGIQEDEDGLTIFRHGIETVDYAFLQRSDTFHDASFTFEPFYGAYNDDDDFGDDMEMVSPDMEMVSPDMEMLLPDTEDTEITIINFNITEMDVEAEPEPITGLTFQFMVERWDDRTDVMVYDPTVTFDWNSIIAENSIRDGTSYSNDSSPGSLEETDFVYIGVGAIALVAIIAGLMVACKKRKKKTPAVTYAIDIDNEEVERAAKRRSRSEARAAAALQITPAEEEAEAPTFLVV